MRLAVRNATLNSACSHTEQLWSSLFTVREGVIRHLGWRNGDDVNQPTPYRWFHQTITPKFNQTLQAWVTQQWYPTLCIGSSDFSSFSYCTAI